MALTPTSSAHALQIAAGGRGRKTGHTFEETLAGEINQLASPFKVSPLSGEHLFKGDPATLLVNYVAQREHVIQVKSISAYATGPHATSENGSTKLSIAGSVVGRCKSDLVLAMDSEERGTVVVGVSVKQSGNANPTNAQLYFTTAQGFTNLLRTHGIPVSELALKALRQFCGDPGFRPLDDRLRSINRVTDPRRWFWEEIDLSGRREWENLFSSQQGPITRLLLQKAYSADPFVPNYLLHKARYASAWTQTEVAIYSVEEVVTLSQAYRGFETKAYSVRKGSYKDPAGIAHDAPRFGIVQMQRGGQAQHPDQLQFNLAAGYFYNL